MTTPADDELSFFDKERDRLSREITTGFEELLSSTNFLNRKMEEVLGMTKEYDTIASLWESFHQLMRSSGQEEEDDGNGDGNSMASNVASGPAPQDGNKNLKQQGGGGLPGTGGHVVAGARVQQQHRGQHDD